MAAITTPTLIQPGEVINGGVLKQGPLNVRFDVALIAPHIRVAEMMHVVPVLQQALYDTMVTKKDNTISNYNTAVGALVDAFPAGGDAAYETLWTKYVMELCAWAVFYEALPWINNQTGSNGTFNTNPDYAQNVGVKGTQYLQDQAKRRIQFLQDEVRKYLCENSGSFPDYDNADCPDTTCETQQDGGKTMARFGLFYSTNN